MEYCPNGDLYKYIGANKGTIPEKEIWAFLIEMLIGIGNLHDRRILHRDIKSENIFLGKNNKIKIGDLGIAKELDSDNSFA